MVTTEIFTMALAPGSDVGDPTTNAALIAWESFETIVKHNGGHKINFGTQRESPQTFEVLINWDSVKAHEDFNNTDSYPAFKERFQTFSGGPPRIIHVDFEPEGALDKVITAPVTEIATLVFGPDGVPSDYSDGLKKFSAALQAAGVPGSLGAAYGFALEEIEIDGKKGKALVFAAGWDSVDAHMQVRDTQAFKDNIHFLRNGTVAAEMHHVQFLEFLPAQ